MGPEGARVNHAMLRETFVVLRVLRVSNVMLRKSCVLAAVRTVRRLWRRCGDDGAIPRDRILSLSDNGSYAVAVVVLEA